MKLSARNRSLLLIGIGVVLLAVVAWFRNFGPAGDIMVEAGKRLEPDALGKTARNPKEAEEPGAPSAAQPTSGFYGVVIDEVGNPIGGAEVEVYFGHFSPQKSPAIQTTNAAGEFHFDRIEEPLVSVAVYRPPKGFLRTNDSKAVIILREKGVDTSMLFVLKQKTTPVIRNRSTPASPIKLTVKHVGPADPIYTAKGNFKMPKDGTPRYFSLDEVQERGRETEPRGHAICIRCWTDKNDFIEPKVNRSYERHYTWRFEISAVNGEIQRRLVDGGTAEEDQAVTAPDQDYAERLEVVFPKDMDEMQWTSERVENAYVRFMDGTVGRIRVDLHSGGAHFVSLETYYNPSGGLNTRFDDSKQLPLKGTE